MRLGAGQHEERQECPYTSIFSWRDRTCRASRSTRSSSSSKAIVEQNGGKVAKIEPWGLKSLTYRIRKNRKAHFTLLNLDAPPAAIAEIERQERINEDVLRFLTIKVDELEEGPSAMMQKRDRDDRGDRGGFGDRGGGFRDRGDRGDRGGDRGGFRRDRGPRREDGEQGEGGVE